MKATAKRNGPLPIVATKCCGNCEHWEALPASAQPGEGPRQGTCFGALPSVHFRPTAECPDRVTTTNPVTLETRPWCFAFTPRGEH